MPGTGLETPQSTYVRYSASLSKDLYLGVFQKLHFNGAYFGGRNLDRFSRYQFGLFDDTRIHGVPASGLRFDELAMARGSYTFNIFDQYRIDLFLEQLPLERYLRLLAAVPAMETRNGAMSRPTTRSRSV